MMVNPSTVIFGGPCRSAGGSNNVIGLTSVSSSLSTDEQRYMDLQGNINGSYDIGDVTAWLDRNPGFLTPALLRRLARWGHQ